MERDWIAEQQARIKAQNEVEEWLLEKLNTISEKYDDKEDLFGKYGYIISALRNVFGDELLSIDDIDYGDGEITTTYYFKIEDKYVAIDQTVSGQNKEVDVVEYTTKQELVDECNKKIDYYKNLLTKINE